MEQLYNLIRSDLEAIDAVIRQRLHSDVVLVRQVAEYIVQSGGKRLRPALVLLSAGALGYRGAYHHELSAVIERDDHFFVTRRLMRLSMVSLMCCSGISM